jgi:hypothetical protein
LVFDIAGPSALRDPGDLDQVVLLAVTPALPLVRLVLVGEAPDLLALGLADDLGGDRRALELSRAGEDGVAVDQQHRPQLHRLLGVDVEPLDLERLALLDAVLLAAGVDDCVHDLLPGIDRVASAGRQRSGTGEV